MATGLDQDRGPAVGHDQVQGRCFPDSERLQHGKPRCLVRKRCSSQQASKHQNDAQAQEEDDW